MKVNARYAKLEPDPVCPSCNSHICLWELCFYSQIMPHNSAMTWKWSCCLCFKCFSYSGQSRYLISQHSTLTELLQWRFLLQTWGEKDWGVSPKEMFNYALYSMWSCLLMQLCLKAIMFEVLDVVSSQKLLMSLTLKGFNTVPNGTTVESITPQNFTTSLKSWCYY